METLEREVNSFFYYKVPEIVDKIEKQVFVIKQSPDYNDYIIESQIRGYLSKNKLNYPVTTFSFQNQVLQNEYRVNSHQIVTLDGTIPCTQATYDEFLKRFIPICQAKFGTHLRIDIQGQMKQYWISFIRMTILERIMNQIIDLTRNKDVLIVLLMDPLEECNFSSLKNNFSKQNSRSKLFYVSTGDFVQKQHQQFSSQLQENYSTEFPTHKITYFYEQYFSGSEASKNKKDMLYSYYQEAVNDITQQLCFLEEVDALQELYQFPWSKLSHQVKRGSIVLSKVNYGDQIAIKHCSSDNLIKVQLDIDQMIDMFSTWVNSIILDYNIKGQLKPIVEHAIDFLSSYMEDFVDKINTTHIPLNKPIENMTVRQRLIAQQSNRCRYNLILLIKSLSNLLTQDTVGDISDEESVERMKIGTQVGKFHQRALVMRGLDVETFIKMKNHFIEILLKVKDTIKFQSDQERSIFSLENMKDIFLQDDMIEGLANVKSQYHLISAFPLVGLGVKLERSDGSMINPYLVKVVDIAKINANVDTVSIQNTPDKELNLNAGFYIGAEYSTRTNAIDNLGYKRLKWTQYQPKKSVLQDLEETQLFYYKSEQLKEKIDAVVPLFGPKDYDLRPLLSTSFFHVLMNFNVMHNVDTCYSEAYLALLSNTLIFLLNQPRSTYNDELIDKIYHSVNIVYGERPFFKTYCEVLLKEPRHAMVTFHEGHPTQCQDPSKALIVLFYLIKNGDLNDNAKIKEILEAILQEIVARGVKNLEKLHTYFGIVGYDNVEFQKIEKEIVEKVVVDVKQYPTIRLMMKKVENALKENNYFDFTKKCKIFVYKDSFNFMNYGKLNFFTSMKAICLYFLPGQVFSGGLLWIWLLHAQKYPNNFTRNTSEMQTSIFKVYSNIKKQKSIYFKKEEAQKIYMSIYAKLSIQFQQEMFFLHMEAIPYSESQILKHLPVDELFNVKFNNVSNLTKNSCLSPKCPFYLKKMPYIAEHIKDIDCVIPGFHKTVKLMKGREPEPIYNAICSGQFLETENIQEFLKQNQRLNSERVQYFLLTKNKEAYINLIENLLIQYKEIQRQAHK